MGGHGHERHQKNSFLDEEIEKVAHVLAVGITPGKLRVGDPDAQLLGNRIDWLQQRKVWGRVEKRVEEIRRELEREHT